MMQQGMDFSDAGVSRTRLVVLRALYAIVAGQAVFSWPALLAQLPAPAHYQGVVLVILAAAAAGRLA